MNEQRTDSLLCLAFVLLGCAAGFALAGVRGTWTDEAATVFAVSKPLAQLWQAITQHDINPPGSYLLWGAWRLLGDSLAHLRALSGVLFGVTLALTYLLGKRLVNRPAGLLAATLLFLSPLALFLSAQVRYPMLLTALLLAASLALTELVSRGSKKAAVAWAILSVAVMYVHYFAAFVLLAHLVVIAVSWRGLPSRRLVWLAFIGMVLLFAPWLPVLVRQWLGRQAAAPGETVAFGHLLPLVFVYLTQGYHFWSLPSFWRELLAPGFNALPALMTLPMLTLAALGLFWRTEERFARRLLIGLALAPLAGYLLLSLGWPMFAPHYFLPFLPYLLLLVAAGLVYLWSKRRAAALALGLLVFLVPVGGSWEFLHQPDVPEGWRPIARAIAAAQGKGDAVVLPNLAARLCYRLHKVDSLPVYHWTMLELGQQVVNDNMVKNLLPMLRHEHRRLWVVQYYPGRFDPAGAVTRAALPDGGLQPSRRLAADPRVGLYLWYLREPFDQGGLSPRITFPDGPQHPFQLGDGWQPSDGDQWWIGAEAHAVLPFREAGRLELDAYLPKTLFTDGVPQIELTMNGEPATVRVAEDGRVTVERTLPIAPAKWVAIRLRCDRTFVPDDIFHDGDRREKCLLVKQLGWR